MFENSAKASNSSQPDIGVKSESQRNVGTVNPSVLFPLDAVLPAGSRNFVVEKEIVSDLGEHRPLPKSALGMLAAIATSMIELPSLVSFELGRKMASRKDSDNASNSQAPSGLKALLNSAVGLSATWGLLTTTNLLIAARLGNLVSPFSTGFTVAASTAYFLTTSYIAYSRGSNLGKAEVNQK